MPTDALTISWLGDPVRLAIVGDIDVGTREQFKQPLARTLGGLGDVISAFCVCAT
jgi:hypothetical protein